MTGAAARRAPEVARPERVTPELVLVAAPEDAKRAREQLPEQPWLLAYDGTLRARERPLCLEGPSAVPRALAAPALLRAQAPQPVSLRDASKPSHGRKSPVVRLAVAVAVF